VTERVLTQRELNRALLARQLLLERVRLPIPRVLERIGGIQNQWAPNAYIRLWSCIEGFSLEDLTRAYERRSVVQGTLMRTTIHTVSRRDYWLLARGLRRSQRRWWLGLQKGSVTDREMTRRAARVRAALADGPLPAKQVEAIGAGYVGLWADFVRVPPSGTWERRRADLYGLAETWVGPSEVTEEDGLTHLVRRYLGGFGPAPLKDIASWAGVRPTELRPALERLELRRFRDEQGGELLDLPRALLPPADTPAPVRFLPQFDATLLAHARRTGVVPEEYRPLLFHTKNPQSVPTFLVDGRVAGIWRHKNGRIVLEPFERISRTTRRQLAEEGERLAAFHSERGDP
jgi:Winged helix DNA-binding domain